MRGGLIMGQSNPERRTFLRLAIHGMGAVFTAALGAPAIAYLIDPLNRPASETNYRTVDGINLKELVLNEPRQGVIRNIRWDAWTLHPNDVVGRIWVVKNGPQDQDIDVFTTVCPHLGCSINFTGDGNFTCPCHSAKFDQEGKILHQEGHQNPAPRDMDTLSWRLHPQKPEWIQVQYINYKTSIAEKIAAT
jgi:Rieske Fe-S protein